ncbi:MAG: AsmA family protein, partial [Geminicoccaceae bacterium]|nr:AsmA family protein [Geminicoccaceae bacterium]
MSRRTTTNKVLITAASAVGIFTLTIDRSPSQAALFDPENWTKAGLKAVFGRVLERRLSIDGDLDIDLGSTLRIVANDVAVENADWASEPQMLQIGRLTVAVDLVQLATGDIVIPEVHVEDPVLFVERSRDGQINWQAVLAGDVIEEPPAPEDEEDAGGGSGIPAIEDLLIQNARIHYLDRLADLDVEGRLERLAGSTGTDDDPAKLKGSGRLAGL